MKASELRIGNYVGFDKDHVFPIKDGISIENHREWEIFDKEFYVPIPITKIWLSKIGLQYDGNVFFFVTKNGLCVYLVNYDVHWCAQVEINGSDIILVEINNIHQLQNLYFALTGEELEIKE